MILILLLTSYKRELNETSSRVKEFSKNLFRSSKFLVEVFLVVASTHRWITRWKITVNRKKSSSERGSVIRQSREKKKRIETERSKCSTALQFVNSSIVGYRVRYLTKNRLFLIQLFWQFFCIIFFSSSEYFSTLNSCYWNILGLPKFC